MQHALYSSLFAAHDFRLFACVLLHLFWLQRVAGIVKSGQRVVITQANHLIVRCLHVRIRYNHHAQFVAQLDLMHVMAFFVEQIGSNRDWQDRADLCSTVLS